MESLADKLRVCIQVSSFAVIFMSIRNLRVLTASFPSFGVLFDTIRFSKTDLFCLFIAVLILTQASVVMCMILFGQTSESYAFPSYATMTLFRMVFGEFDYKHLEADTSYKSKLVAALFFFPFMLVFFFIVMNMFAAIVMRTYDNLRVKRQLVTEAMAMLMHEENEKSRRIW
jgi:hypothetical protein